MEIVGARIQERLSKLDMSQAELARRVRLSQPAINGLVRGKARSTPELHRIARELETTPAYLSGETDDPEADAPDAPSLSYDQLELLDCFARLDADEQKALLAMARVMASKHEPPARTAHAPPVGYRPERG